MWRAVLPAELRRDEVEGKEGDRDMGDVVDRDRPGLLSIIAFGRPTQMDDEE